MENSLNVLDIWLNEHQTLKPSSCKVSQSLIYETIAQDDFVTKQLVGNDWETLVTFFWNVLACNFFFILCLSVGTVFSILQLKIDHLTKNIGQILGQFVLW